MRYAPMILAGLLLVAGLSAQDRPYQEGDVNTFLASAKQSNKPSIVLFNFDGESG